VTFEWDEAKAATNLAKHRVAFDEAKTVFDDPSMLIFTIPNIPPMSLATLLSERPDKAEC